MKKYFKILNIDVFVYSMTKESFKEFGIKTNKELSNIKIEALKNNKKLFTIKKGKDLVHKSILFDKVFLLKLIKRKGPAIGDCYTNPEYRGLSLYPHVINQIAKQVFKKNAKEVFIIVNKDNISSIKGIEKAHFKKYASINTKRWLFFYFNKKVKFFK